MKSKTLLAIESSPEDAAMVIICPESIQRDIVKEIQRIRPVHWILFTDTLTRDNWPMKGEVVICREVKS